MLGSLDLATMRFVIGFILRTEATLLLVFLAAGCSTTGNDAGEPLLDAGGVAEGCTEQELRGPSGGVQERCASSVSELPTRLCGNCTVDDPAFLEMLEDVEVIEGNLSLGIAGVETEVSLPNLRSVESIALRGGSATALLLPSRNRPKQDG